MNLDWDDQSITEYADLLGEQPSNVVSFVPVPFSAEERQWVVQAAEQAHAARAVHLLTLEPTSGLAALTDDMLDDLANLLNEVTSTGVPVIVRFAHEMNGSWYAWGQQPEGYIAAFRRVADRVHEIPGAATMWAPNYGGGYPFTGGTYAADERPKDEAALDTDGDGTLDGADDPYAPYYPGDEYVDWVGMSLYHWGSAVPWGENELPEPGKFVAQLTGTYDGLGGDDTAVPDFYTEYGELRGKPVAIPETAAFVIPGGDESAETAIRRAWWRQVFAEDTHERLPMLRLVNWFEWVKYEPEVDDIVAWSALDEQSSRRAFIADRPDWLEYGPAICEADADRGPTLGPHDPR
ncbi:glycoside hydrolase family 26 protein [Microbacterium sp. HJ5]